MNGQRSERRWWLFCEVSPVPMFVIIHDSWMLESNLKLDAIAIYAPSQFAKKHCSVEFQFLSQNFVQKYSKLPGCTGQPLIRVKCFGIFSLNNGDEIYKLYILFILYHIIMEAILFRIYGTYDVYCVPHILQGMQWMFLFMIFFAGGQSNLSLGC